MTVYIMNDTGEIFDVTSNVQLVELLRETSWQQGGSINDWMRETAVRYREEGFADFKGDSANEFVNSLLSSGLMKEKE